MHLCASLCISVHRYSSLYHLFIISLSSLYHLFMSLFVCFHLFSSLFISLSSLYHLFIISLSSLNHLFIISLSPLYHLFITSFSSLFIAFHCYLSLFISLSIFISFRLFFLFYSDKNLNSKYHPSSLFRFRNYGFTSKQIKFGRLLNSSLADIKQFWPTLNSSGQH